MNHPTYIKVAAVMKTEIRTIDPMSSVSEAMILMSKNGVSSLVIERRDEHDEYGLIVVSDIAKEIIAAGRSPDRVNVYEIMSKPVVSVHADMDVRYCSRMFDQFGLATAPVLLEGQIIGIVDYQALVLNGLAELY